MNTSTKFGLAALVLPLVAGLGALVLTLAGPPAMAAEATARGALPDIAAWGLAAAAVSTALAALGAGFAVAKVGTAAIGALAEKPELFGRLLIFVGLAEGIAIYGLIVSILILNRLG